MSNVLLESAATGRFIITTDNPGCEETVVDGKTGYIYRGGDVDAFVEAIKRFLNLPNSERKKMGEEGRKHIESFSRENVIAAYSQEINELLKK